MKDKEPCREIAITNCMIFLRPGQVEMDRNHILIHRAAIMPLEDYGELLARAHGVEIPPFVDQR